MQSSGGGFHLGSLYCYSGIGIRAPMNLRLLEEVAATLRGITGPWVIGCDANCTPQALLDTGWLDLVGGVVHAPEHATCNGKVYDFFITSRCCSHAVRRVTTVDDAEFKPHSPARMWLDAKPRSDKFRQLANIGKFEAHLPHGPLRAFHHSPAPDVDAGGAEPAGTLLQAWEDYGTIITDIEAALADIKGLDEAETAKHTGRADGPRFRMATASATKTSASGGKRQGPGDCRMDG